MAAESFEIAMVPDSSRPLVQGAYRDTIYRNIDFHLREISRLEEQKIVLCFEGVRRDNYYREHSALIVLKNGTYGPAIHIVTGPQGSLDVQERKVEVAPDARAFLDAIIEKLMTEKTAKSA